MQIKWMIFFVFAIFMTHQPSHAQAYTPTACDFTAIQQAIADANETGSGVIILDCTEPIIFSHRLEVTSNIVIDGGGVTILDGGFTVLDGRSGRSFFSVFSDASLTLIGITLQNGRDAIYNNGMLTVINSHFMQNKTMFYGAAIHTILGSLTVVNSTFSDNIASGYGGAIRAEDANVFILNSKFTNNVANHGGGAILLGSSSRGTIHDTDFIGNSAGWYGDAIQNYGTLTLTNGRIADEIHGDAIWNMGTLTLSDMIITNNSSGGDGHAIWNGNILTITNTCISSDGDVAIYDHAGNTYDDIPACPTE
jgi:predicted outer membrane repeat protein